MQMQFDLTGAGEPAIGGEASGAPPRNDEGDRRLTEAARLLEASGRFRVLRRLEPRVVRPDLRPVAGDGKRLVVVLDTETTGLDRERDTIIELGMIAATFDRDGLIDVVGRYEGLQQPPSPLSPEIARLTGLTDEMLAGRRIDLQEVDAFVAGADLVVAHNAGFDRPFCEAALPVFRDKAWACSAREIDWRRLGVDGARLGHVLAAYGYFHGGHRALADCDALLECLVGRPPSGAAPAFLRLLEAAGRATVEIRAENSPFRCKDQLKSRGYRWSDGSDGRSKCWKMELAEEDADDELEFLRREVYRAPIQLPCRRLTAIDRHR